MENSFVVRSASALCSSRSARCLFDRLFVSPSRDQPKNGLQLVAPFSGRGGSRAARPSASAPPLAHAHARALAPGGAAGAPKTSDVGRQKDLCLVAATTSANPPAQASYDHRLVAA